MTLRWRLVLALLLAGLTPLLPLVLTVQSVVRTSVRTLAPEEIGDALSSGFDLARRELERQQQDLLVDLDALLSQPGSEIDSRTLAPGDSLYRRNSDGSWSLYQDSTWIDVNKPSVPREDFSSLPDRLRAQKLVDGTPYLISRGLDDDLQKRAELLRRYNASWSVRASGRERLLSTLLLVFVLTYLLATLIAVGVATIVVIPTTRRIEDLTRLADAVREGEENRRVESSGRGEVGRLATSFNLMLDRLAESRNKAAEMEKMAAWRQLARILAHEIKNPLTPIQLSVQQLADSYTGDDERFAQSLATTREIVDEEIETLRRLVREFGDFARAPQLSLEPTLPAELGEELEQLYGAPLELSLHAVEEWSLDREKLRRALINLLDNALAAAGEGARVRLTIEESEVELLLIVEDNGPGVPEQEWNTVFEPYYTTKRSGMGLGLPIVRTTCQQHGGDISLDRSPGLGGARFSIRLPRHGAPSSSAGEEHSDS